MSLIQRVMMAVLPEASAKSMEAESREWMHICQCGHARSAWELGGIRWGASGKPRRLVSCPACGKCTWHTVSRNPPTLTE